ncbi:MAG TPA: amidohydrolase [Candidatus Cybelea sp.]|nr:amidohydrolase [Candidatus Cybelea sp.]
MSSQEPADLILCGGTIHSADARDPSPQAFAVANGRFVYTGSLDGAMALRGPATMTIDASGCTILPGLVDAHLHLTGLGLKLERVILDGARSEEEMVERVTAYARSSREEWILGRGWDENLWPRAAFPAHQILSAAIDDRPVALARVDGHALLANARALAIAKIDRATADPAGGRIVRDARGEPTGVLIDEAQTLIYDRVPKPSHERLVAAVRAAIAECNRWGVTAVAEPGCDAAMLAAQMDLLERGEYTIRNAVMIDDDPALIAARARIGVVEAACDGRLWVRSIKMYADGALGSHGAAMLEPYSDDLTNSGLVLSPRAHIEEVALAALDSGFQACVHAIGDRANRMVLDVFETVRKRAGDGAARPRIEHAQIVAPQDISRFAELGVIASIQATHALSDMPWVPSRLGPARLERAYPWRALLDAGAIVANGTDAPVESPSSARTFAASIGAHGAIDHRITRAEALASMTSAAAYANFQDICIGSIAPGKYADFVVMDRDWMIAAPEDILETTVLATYFAGRKVYGSM